MIDLSGQTAIVTGASTGIGRALAIELGKSGCTVGLVARREDLLKDTRERIAQIGGKAYLFPTDLSEEQSVKDLANQILREFDFVNILANVAAIWHVADHALYGPRFHETPLEEVLNVFDVGIRAPLILTRLLIPGMVENGSGHIINVSGTFSDNGAVGWLHYFLGKKALEQFTVGLAQEYGGNGINVNCVCPADVATEPYKQFFPEDAATALDPEEVVDVIMGLVSPKAKNIHGQIVEVRRK